MLAFLELKTTYDQISRQIQFNQEPTAQIQTLAEYFRALAQNPTIFDNVLDEEPALDDPKAGEPYLTTMHLRYIFEDVAPGIVKKMQRERSNDATYLEVCALVLKELLLLSIPIMQRKIWNVEFLLAIREIMQHECTLHRLHFQISDEEIQRLFTKGSGQQWRTQLKVGDRVDALLHYYDLQRGHSRGAGWSQAQILEIDGDKLQLNYLLEPKSANRTLDRWSNELAQFESETKEIWAYKEALKPDDLVDCQDDTYNWRPSHIVEIFTIKEGDKAIPMAKVGLRVYVASGSRTDERGAYDGFGSRFDEDIPLYSPKITHYRTMSLKEKADVDGELDESLDEFAEPYPGCSRPWTVPRPRKCTSLAYLQNISAFAEAGGLAAILKAVREEECSDKPGEFDLTVLACLFSAASFAAAVYHKDVVADFGAPLLVEARKKLLGAPDKALRDMRRDAIDAILRAVEAFNKRVLKREERKASLDELRLDVCLLCINSSFLQRRIQGISDLTSLIKHSRLATYTNPEQCKIMVKWLLKNKVLETVFDPAKTHLQIVQRTDELIKLLLAEDELTLERLQQFWALTKTEMRMDIYKIIADCSYNFKQPHLDFIFDQICTGIPASKLDMEDFNCLSELGKSSRDRDSTFHKNVTKFFWRIATGGEGDDPVTNLEVISHCSTKYRDMVKFNSRLEAKQEMCVELVRAIKEGTLRSSAACIDLLQGILKDQSDRTQTSTYSYGGSANYVYGANNNSTYPSAYGATGTALRGAGAGQGAQGGQGGQGASGGTGDPQDARDDDEEKKQEPEKPKELDLQGLLGSLQTDNEIMSVALVNLKAYCELAKAHVAKLPAESNIDRTKIHVGGCVHSHHDEIDKRLGFIKFYAQINESYVISQKELGVIYDLLVTASAVPSDEQEFLTWCKSSCESQSSKASILDMKEVGQFFTEKIQKKELNLKSLGPTGFDFLKQYFLSVNKTTDKIEDVKPKTTGSNYSGYGTTSNYGGRQYGYGNDYRYSWSSASGGQGGNKNEKEEKKFALKVLPSNLEELDMLWTLVLECQHPDVSERVVEFFIQVHMQLGTELESEKKTVLLELIGRCMAILNEPKQGAHVQKRIISILKQLINETEARGASSITPHGALMRGETCEVTVKNDQVTLAGGELRLQVCSNSTLWDLKTEVARTLDFAPQFIKMSIGKTYQNRQQYTDQDNCKTMKALGITGGEYLLAAKELPVVAPAPAALIDLQTNNFTRDAERIFEMLFDMYAEDDGTWSKMSTHYFIMGCVGERSSGPGDSRVEELFAQYDKDKDGKLQQADFFEFYMTASRDRKGTVMDNLKNFNVRPDLRKWSEVGDAAAPKKEELPRYFLSTQQEHFERLMGLLGTAEKSLASDVWELIQMLATNQEYYKRVLTLDAASSDGKKKAGGEVEWNQLFDKAHPYNLLYSQQIVQAVIADGDADSKRAQCLNTEDFATAKLLRKKYRTGAEVTALTAELAEGAEFKATEVLDMKARTSSAAAVLDPEEEEALRAAWAKEFVTRGGFQFILQDFMTCELDSASSHEENVDLKYIAFSLQVMRTFLMATYASNDLDAYKVAKLARKESTASQTKDEPPAAEEEDARAKQLQDALEGEAGEQILKAVDFEKLQNRIIQVIAHSLKKGQGMQFEDKIIIENALNLWVGCLQFNDKLFAAFTAVKDVEGLSPADFLMQGLLYCGFESVREEFKILLANLCKSQSSKSSGPTTPLSYIVQLLTNYLTKLSGQPSRQYLGLFVLVLGQISRRNTLGSTDAKELVDSDKLLSLVIDQISNENARVEKVREDSKAGRSDPVETGKALAQSQEFLLGLMYLAGEILDTFEQDSDKSKVAAPESTIKQRQGLLNEIFARYLFPMVFSAAGGAQGETTMANVIEQKMMNSAASGKAKQSQSSVAYKVLLGLVKRDSELMGWFIKNCLNPVVEKIQRAATWTYQPPVNSNRKAEYVGLRNPGCICYMNSMNQQFFMVPALRYNLLAVDDGVPENPQLYKGDQIDDNVLHQFQHIMANLELGQTSDYLPKGYCFAFKDFDGQPTNTGEQKDAQEYLTAVFDRLEGGLKNTSRKHLVSSIFGLKTCSQLICKDGCGRVKNRIEDAYNLSVTVKDLKGIHPSLEAQMEGEVISDYECSGCKKKVDIHKRTLLAETPNVLIVHLQRLLFDFNTFQNEKMNQYFEFPHELDLTPYSYHAVMEKEGRVKKEGEEEEEKKEEPAEEGEEAEEPNPEPILDDCFEYTLAGVTVHSGTANAGHYWSYASTERDGLRPVRADDAPADHLNAKWMEFNDSFVRDWEVTQLKKEAFGGEQSSSWNTGSIGVSSFGGGWSIGGGGGSYGQSGYMLVYERKKKKPIKLCRQVPSDEPVEEGQEPATKEEIYEIDYHKCVEPADKPNKIFNEVLELNAKLGFEQEVYQQEFFDFVYGIQKSIAATQQSDGPAATEAAQALRREAIAIANKATLEIYASAAGCSKVEEAFSVLAELLHQDKTCTLHKEFLEYWWDCDKFNYLYQLLLENPDLAARKAFAKFMRYILVTLKMAEKDYLDAGEEYTVHGDNDTKMTMVREKSLAVRFIMHGIGLFNTKVAKFWNRFEPFLETLYFFGVADTDAVNRAMFGPAADAPRAEDLDTKTEAARVGLAFYAKKHFLQSACDFMLGSKSPLCAVGEKRPELGNYSASADLSFLVNLMTVLMEDAEIQKAHPPSQQEKELLQHPALLKSVLASPKAQAFANFLAEMCREDYRLSKKVSKVFLHAIEGAVYDSIGNYLVTLRPFLKLNDSLKAQRLEWVFGVPDHRSQKTTDGTERTQYGNDMNKHINEDVLIYESPILHPNAQRALAMQIVKSKGSHGSQCITCLKELTQLMVEDEDVTRFLFNLPAPGYTEARFTDWFEPYLLGQHADQKRMQSAHYRGKLDDINEALGNMDKLRPVFQKLLDEQMARMKKALADKKEYSDLEETKWPALANATGEVIQHFPPGLIIGQLTSAEEHYFTYDADELVTLDMVQVAGEWSYSAPTGMFNLACPDRKRKAAMHYMAAETYQGHRHKLATTAAASAEKKEGEETAAPTQADTDAKIASEIDLEHWEKNKKVGPLLLRVKLDFKLPAGADKDVKIWYKISSKSGNEDNVNVVLPVSRRKVHLSAGHRRLSESLRIKDPSKGYFFKDVNDIKIEMEVTVVRDAAAARGAVGQIGGTGFQRTQKTVQIQEAGDPDYYADDGDDNTYGAGADDGTRYAAFQEYQSGAGGGDAAFQVHRYDGEQMQDEQAMGDVLALNMGGDPQDAQERRSNSSTEAVGAYNNDITDDLGVNEEGGFNNNFQI